LTLQVQAEEGVAYTTQFVGTRAGYPTAEAEAMVGENASVTRRYSDEIGVVFAEVAGTHPAYTVTGDELYVRAKVISSKRKANPYRAGEVEVAWTQPVVIRR
jgi:hypothetical protein